MWSLVSELVIGDRGLLTTSCAHVSKVNNTWSLRNLNSRYRRESSVCSDVSCLFLVSIAQVVTHCASFSHQFDAPPLISLSQMTQRRSVIVSSCPLSVTRSSVICHAVTDVMCDNMRYTVTMAAIRLTMSFVVDQHGDWRRQPFPPLQSWQTINYFKTV